MLYRLTFHLWIFTFICLVSLIEGRIEQKYADKWILSIKGGYSTARLLAQTYRFTILREVIDGHYLIQNSHRIRKLKFHAILKEPKVIQMEKDILRRRYQKSVNINYFNDPEWKRMWYLVSVCYLFKGGFCPSISYHLDNCGLRIVNAEQCRSYKGNRMPISLTNQYAFQNEQNGVENMNIKKAWEQGYTGDGIVIAIVDDGVDVSHADLGGKYLQQYSYDYFDNDANPRPSTSLAKHGTNCAGIAVAFPNNSNCVVGAAYDSKLAAIRFMDGLSASASSEAGSLTHKMKHIHIYSNSWGVQDRIGFDGPTLVVKESIKKGITEGRNGLGSIYVWAAGNGGQIKDNCNCDGYVNSIYTIAITSAESDNYLPYYAEKCPAALAAAYSSDEIDYNIITTTTGNKCENFTGTSASAPLAAAVIALTLQANNNLTWRDLQHIIVQTAKRHNLIDRDWKTNGAGRSVSSLFGYGLLDAIAMVTKAKSWVNVKEQHSCTCLENIVSLDVIGTSQSAVDILSTEACNDTEYDVKSIEHIEVVIRFEANKHGFIEIYLTSPMGTISQLLSRRTDDTNSGPQIWTFMSVHYWDEDPVGDWKIEMKGINPTLIGKLSSWQLVIHGTGIHEKTANEETDADISRRYSISTEDRSSETNIGKITGGVVGGVGTVVVVTVITVGIIVGRKLKKHPSAKRTNDSKLPSTGNEKNVKPRNP